jgi:phospholipid/cholesterol/gamma-HCH transport system substrate-binding protein
LQNTIANLENTSFTLNEILSDNKGKLSSIFENVDAISTNLRSNNEALSNAIRNASHFTDSLAKLNLSKTLTEVDLALQGVTKITRQINNGEGSLGKLIQSDSLHNQVLQASQSLDFLLNDMRVNPKRYLSFSMIGRKEDSDEFSKKELEQIRTEIDNRLKNR